MAIAWAQTNVSAENGVNPRLLSQFFDDIRRFTFKAGCGRLSSAAARFPDATITIGFVHSTGHRIQLSETDELTVLMPRQGRIETEMGGNCHIVRPGQLLALRPGERLTTTTPDGEGVFEALMLLVPVASLASPSDGIVPPAGNPDGQRLTGIAARRLGAALADIAGELRRLPAGQFSDRTARRVSALLVELTGTACLASDATDSPGTWRGDDDLVRAALQLMRAGAGRPMTVAEVARDLGISPRRLQLAFKRSGEASPRDVLANIRLQLARDRLVKDEEGSSVTDIAFQSGFFHLGRFSAQYRRAFGELPSETLARARA